MKVLREGSLATIGYPERTILRHMYAHIWQDNWEFTSSVLYVNLKTLFRNQNSVSEYLLLAKWTYGIFSKADFLVSKIKKSHMDTNLTNMVLWLSNNSLRVWPKSYPNYKRMWRKIIVVENPWVFFPVLHDELLNVDA